MRQKEVIIVGAGFGGLALGALLARQGLRVRILEKNAQPGGRARVWNDAGFRFDMGPTWYLMPEVFDDFFTLFGRRREEFFRLVRLDPSYRVFFGGGKAVDVVADRARNLALFEGFQGGGAAALERYLVDAKYKYEVALRDFLYKEYSSVFQFLNRRMILEGLKLGVLGSLDRYTARYFSDRRARQILEYHMVFLGNSPKKAPALYSLMSHADLNVGVFYPLRGSRSDRNGGSAMGGSRAERGASAAEGGIGCIVEALLELCRSLGVEVLTGHEVEKILVRGGAAAGVRVKGGAELAADIVAVDADYPHAETALLDPAHRSYPAAYWKRKVIAPSMFLLYLGVGKKLRSLAHHSLYFAEDWDAHFRAITEKPTWPRDPCFYLCAPTGTDPSTAPAGCEALTVLVPVAAGLPDTPEIRAAYREAVLSHVETTIGETFRDGIRTERIFTLNDFCSDYNAYQGTALGLAHTLGQTAIFRPRHRSRRVSRLWYTGGYTHPGIGVPMTFISSRIVAEEIAKSVSG
jgi:1-hydroxy-2-isopentenylcarotenoid 3,4-desaturase